MGVINTQQVQINEIPISQAATKTSFAHELKDFHREHMKLVTQLQEQLQHKETENSDLQRKVIELTLETHSLKWSSFTKKPKDLVLSDSMLGLVDPPKLVATKLVPMSGGQVHTLKEELMKPEYHGAKYRKVTHNLQDAKGEVAKLAGVVEQYKELISNSKAIAENVIVSSVCPRLDDVVSELVEPLNTSLKMMCEENGAIVIDNTPINTLGDGTINDGYLEGGKGPHRTKEGVNKLVRNLMLNIKDPESDVTKDLGRHGYSKPQYGGHGKRAPYGSEEMPFATRQPPTRSQQQCKRTDVVYYSYRCVYCNEPGHNSSTCRHQSAVQCNKCGVKGHKSKHHTAYDAGQEESATSESLEYDITETVDMSDELDLKVHNSESDSSVIINDVSEPIVTDFNDNDANVVTFPHFLI